MSDVRIQHFYHEPTGTLSYVVADRQSARAAVIDSVIGYSQVSGHTDTRPAETIIEYLCDERLTLDWILETHAHADHLSGAQTIKAALGGTVGIGKGIRKVQAHFGPVFNGGVEPEANGSEFDALFDCGEHIRIGGLDCEVIATPGHTNDSVSYRIGSAVFVGDSLFMPDYGTARCDFPGGDSGQLYDSIRRLLELPADTLLYMCHDYLPDNRELRWKCTVAEQRAQNVHIRDGVSREAFTAMREQRDATLDLPALIVPSIQVNIRGGHLPDAEANGIAYIKTPIDTL